MLGESATRVRPIAAVQGAIGFLALLATLGLGVAPHAGAHTSEPSPFPRERPGDRLSESPLPTPLPADAPSLLPPIPGPSIGEIQGDDPLNGIMIRSIEFRGNETIDSLMLGQAARPFLDRRLSAEGLEALRRQVTVVYVAAGFVNSGAAIPAQPLADGRLVIAILEGRLATIQIRGLKHYRSSAVEKRLRARLSSPLNIRDVEREIQLLNQDPRIERIAARLRPGVRRDEAVLELDVVEANPYALNLRFDNEESPSVGAYAGSVYFSHLNPLGFGDQVRLSFSKSEGLTRIRGRYDLPINSHGTSLLFEARYGYAELVDNVAKKLDIVSTDANFAIGVTQNFWHDPKNRFDVSLLFDRSRSKTALAGQGESFVDGPQNGRSEVSALRVVAEWNRRNSNSAIALRTLFSWGTDWFNPTTRQNDTPDAEFFSFFAQGRGVYRLPRSGIEFRVRGDVQLADDALLSLEQFAVGGPGSVRGVRRNTLVRDQGLSASLDIRFPLIRSTGARTILALSPIYDVGYAWNCSRPTPALRTLSSLGAKLEWFPHPNIELGIQYAYDLRGVNAGHDLQDRSVYLFAQWRAF